MNAGPHAGNTWGWAQTVALIVPFVSVLGAILVAAITYLLNQRSARRERRAKVFAEALAAIEDYAEMPYRIRRRAADAGARHLLTAEISSVKSRIAFHQAWLQIEAPDVSAAYDNLDQAARRQAGVQMSSAWNETPFTRDDQMNLGVAYPRDQIDDARAACINAMINSLGRRSRHLKEGERSIGAVDR